MIPSRMSDEEVRDLHLRGLVSTRTCVVQEQQERMVPTSLLRRLIGCSQQRIHFRFLEVCDHRSRCSFKGNVSDLTAPLHVFWAIQANKAGKGADCSQPLITRGRGALAGLLQM